MGKKDEVEATRARLDKIQSVLDEIDENLDDEETTPLDGMADRLNQITTMGYLHDERLARIEIALQTLTEEEKEYRRGQRVSERAMDERIGKLVEAIGSMVRQPPPKKSLKSR